MILRNATHETWIRDENGHVALRGFRRDVTEESRRFGVQSGKYGTPDTLNALSDTLSRFSDLESFRSFWSSKASGEASEEERRGGAILRDSTAAREELFAEVYTAAQFERREDEIATAYRAWRFARSYVRTFVDAQIDELSLSKSNAHVWSKRKADHGRRLLL